MCSVNLKGTRSTASEVLSFFFYVSVTSVESGDTLVLFSDVIYLLVTKIADALFFFLSSFFLIILIFIFVCRMRRDNDTQTPRTLPRSKHFIFFLTCRKQNTKGDMMTSGKLLLVCFCARQFLEKKKGITQRKSEPVSRRRSWQRETQYNANDAPFCSWGYWEFQWVKMYFNYGKMILGSESACFFFIDVFREFQTVFFFLLCTALLSFPHFGEKHSHAFCFL